MSTLPRSHRRIVLVDFDWQDADLMPRLLAEPGISVRLVAGEDRENAGLRLAEMCGLPRTTDLGDLTREIFDVALLSERSPRRAQVEGLLSALGTPCCPPGAFLSEQADNGCTKPAEEALPVQQLEAKAVELESALSGRDVEELLAEALPVAPAAAPSPPPRPKPPRAPILEVLDLTDFPSPEDRLGLELALRNLAASTGAGHAVLRMGGPENLEVVAEIGPSDALTEVLIQTACEQGASQVVTQLVGPQQGKAWGAWPFRTPQRRAVVAAAGIDPAPGWSLWQDLVEELRQTWDQRDRERVGPAFPLVPERRGGWSVADEFSDSLELAAERNRRDGLRFTLHRLQFTAPPEAVDRLCSLLPDHLRDRDVLVRPQKQVVLLLTAGPRESFSQLQKRIVDLWDQSWRESGGEPPAPPVGADSLELASPEAGPLFLATARAWLAAH